MKILHQYIMRQTAVTLAMSLSVFTFVLVLGNLLPRLSDLLVNRQMAVSAVLWYVALLTPFVLTWSLPLAILATMLLVCGRLSADNEITALRASGVSLGQVVAPLILFSAVMAAACWYVNATVAPLCRLRFKMLALDVATTQPAALLEERSYIKDFPGYVIYVGKSSGDVLEDVTVFVLDAGGNVSSSLRARTAVLRPQPEARKVLLDLYDVRGDLRDPKDPTDVRKIRPGITARRYPLELDLSRLLKQAGARRDLRNLMFSELREEIKSLRQRGVYPAAALMEAHQRMAGAVACIAFAVVGIPLGIRVSRRETSIGIAISLFLAMGYNLFVVLANALRNRPHLYPEAILWLPNLALELLGLWLLWRVARA
jgi:lipopolysaccharide export system permease protein